ncbi:MAG: RNA polymerase sigma factor RpoD/SigA [Spirochaetaceae bacterium]|jgi:RNA polymerase primary sigma factor|nr:RNA polymerase sigma factor RpoD/SigA [Spirochaetaceae bacterium]
MNKKVEASYENDGLQAYFKQIKAIPLIDFEEELELSKRIKDGDPQAQRRLIEANLRLVVKIARSYCAPDVPLMDIIQEGNLGLMHAAEKYDHLKSVRFSTYATFWIRQSISRFLTNKRRTIRLPHRKEELFNKMQKTYYALSQVLTRQPNTEEIAAKMGLPIEDIEEILRMTNGLISLEMEAGYSENTAMMDLQEDYTYSPERTIFKKSSRDATQRMLGRLKERERRILTYRYQLDGGGPYTLKTIGDKMGLSPETVRQIEKRAINKIRRDGRDVWAALYEEAM